jgi:flagellar biosynthesis/type III secretory pathway chaperone
MAMNAPTRDPADVVTGIMLQITQHAERLALLDQREADHCREMTNRLDEHMQQLAETREQVDAIHDLAARQAALLETLNSLDQQVSALATRLTHMTAASPDKGGETYQPAPSPRWWKLNETERDKAINRLRAWVEQIYRPGYGHLAAALGTCWDQHPLCLYGLDWLMELWSALYLAAERNTSTLASQAEWQMRLLPALAEQLHLETTRCDHDQLASGNRKHAVQNALNRTTS